MASIKGFKTDAKRSEDGVWIPIRDGLKLKIARFGNPKHQEFLRKHGKDQRAAVRAGVRDQEAIQELTLKAAGHCILLGWENLQDENDKDIEYSKDKACELLKSLPEFAELVITLSQDADNFRAETVEVAAGN